MLCVVLSVHFGRGRSCILRIALSSLDHAQCAMSCWHDVVHATSKRWPTRVRELICVSTSASATKIHICVTQLPNARAHGSPDALSMLRETCHVTICPEDCLMLCRTGFAVPTIVLQSAADSVSTAVVHVVEQSLPLRQNVHGAKPATAAFLFPPAHCEHELEHSRGEVSRGRHTKVIAVNAQLSIRRMILWAKMQPQRSQLSV